MRENKDVNDKINENKHQGSAEKAYSNYRSAIFHRNFCFFNAFFDTVLSATLSFEITCPKLMTNMSKTLTLLFGV